MTLLFNALDPQNELGWNFNLEEGDIDISKKHNYFKLTNPNYHFMHVKSSEKTLLKLIFPISEYVMPADPELAKKKNKHVLEAFHFVDVTLQPDEQWKNFSLQSVTRLVNHSVNSNEVFNISMKFKQPGVVTLTTKLRMKERVNLRVVYKKHLYVWELNNKLEMCAKITREMDFQDCAFDLNLLTRLEYDFDKKIFWEIAHENKVSCSGDLELTAIKLS